MTSLRKMLSWIQGLLDGNGPLPPFALSIPTPLRRRCTVQAVFPSLHGWLMEGGLNILHFTPLIPPLYSSPPSLLLFACAFAECTHDPVCAAAVRRCASMTSCCIFGIAACKCPRCDSEGGRPRLAAIRWGGSSRGDAPPPLKCTDGAAFHICSWGLWGFCA